MKLFLQSPAQIFRLFLLLLPILGTSNTLAADEVRYYDFEIIVFESNDPAARLTEVWETATTLPVPEKFIQINSPYPGPMPRQYSPKLTFKRLPKSSYRLKQEAKLLIENDKNRILLHTSWRQPGMSAETALPIYFKREFINTITTAPVQKAIDPDSPISDAALTTPDYETHQSRSRLEGYIRIILSRYLHADVNLTYTTGLPIESTTLLTPTDAGTEEETEAVRQPIMYRLQETRKMRSKELHYLDHPVLGMLILATPYKGKTLKAR